MKVLFVTHNDTSHEPLGLMYVSSALIKAGHLTAACEEKNVFSEIDSFRPDFVGFQVITGDQDRWGKVALRIKKQYPAIKTILAARIFCFLIKSGRRARILLFAEKVKNQSFVWLKASLGIT